MVSTGLSQLEAGPESQEIAGDSTGMTQAKDKGQIEELLKVLEAGDVATAEGDMGK